MCTSIVLDKYLFTYIVGRFLSQAIPIIEMEMNQKKNFLESRNLQEIIQSYYQVLMYTCLLYVWHVRGIGAGRSGTVLARADIGAAVRD